MLKLLFEDVEFLLVPFVHCPRLELLYALVAVSIAKQRRAAVCHAISLAKNIELKYAVRAACHICAVRDRTDILMHDKHEGSTFPDSNKARHTVHTASVSASWHICPARPVLRHAN